jgi:hypothetical protein
MLEIITYNPTLERVGASNRYISHGQSSSLKASFEIELGPLDFNIKYTKRESKTIKQKDLATRGVIGEVRCGFLRISAPTSYSAVFLFHASAPAPTKIGLGAVRCGLMWCGLAVWVELIWAGLDQPKCQF